MDIPFISQFSFHTLPHGCYLYFPIQLSEFSRWTFPLFPDYYFSAFISRFSFHSSLCEHIFSLKNPNSAFIDALCWMVYSDRWPSVQWAVILSLWQRGSIRWSIIPLSIDLHPHRHSIIVHSQHVVDDIALINKITSKKTRIVLNGQFFDSVWHKPRKGIPFSFIWSVFCQPY